MKVGKGIVAGVLAGVFVSAPVLAAEKVCLQHNRLFNWKAKDEVTMVMTDLDHKPYIVHLTEGCQGLTDATARLIFRHWMDLACLDPGDLITVTSLGLGPRMCSVESVEAGTPVAAHN